MWLAVASHEGCELGSGKQKAAEMASVFSTVDFSLGRQASARFAPSRETESDGELEAGLVDEGGPTGV